MYQIKSIAKSFTYAYNGLVYALKNEKNMRIHLFAVIFVSIFSYFYQTTQLELAIIVLCFTTVLTTEAINTAIENLVNLGADGYNQLAKIAKDVAAGAVLISSIGSVIIALLIFLDIQRLQMAIQTIMQNPINIIGLIIIFILGVLFIFTGDKIL